MGNNVTIPLPLLKNLITLLEYWDVSLFDRAVRDDYWDALCALRLKQLKLDIHAAYTMMAKAPNENARLMARIEYLRLKNQLAADNDF